MNVVEKTMKRVYNYNAMKKILSFYGCPDECQAYCCKHGEIQILESGFKRLRAIDKNRIYDIEKLPIHVADNGFKFVGYCIHTPCAFLKDNKCTAQTRKPWTCAIYPFRVSEDIPQGFVAIQPCKMGIKMIEDWTDFAILEVRKEGWPQAMLEDNIQNKRRLLELFRDESTVFENKEIVKELHIHVLHLDPFANYLQKKKGGSKHCNP